MSEPEPFDLVAVKQRALVRQGWVRGRIGDPVPWCRYCGVKLPGETEQAWNPIGHEEGCPVPEARSALIPDFEALVTQVQRLHAPAQILPAAPPIELRPGEAVDFDAATGEVVVLRAEGTERLRQPAEAPTRN